MTAPTITLNNGQKIPMLGLGTWQCGNDKVEQIIKDAIEAGYRHFDCAMLYGNEAGIGKAIREMIAEGVVERKDIFVVTKLWNFYHKRELVVPTCRKSLENFGLDYVDLYLIHWPMAQKQTGELISAFPFANALGIDYDYVDTWKGMEDCVKFGLAKGIGLSNFNSKQIERVLSNAIIKPLVNQIEVHPNLKQKKLIAFCEERDIVVTAYSPFGSPNRLWTDPEDPVLRLDDERLIKIAEKYGKTAAQVVLRYLIDIGTVPIPKSANTKRIKENINIFDFKLSREEIELIDTFECNGRVFRAIELKASPCYPFLEEF